MSEEFEKWWDKNKKYIKKPCTLVEFNATKTGAAAGYRAATETMKAKLDAQSEELAALRSFAKYTIATVAWSNSLDKTDINDAARQDGLLDTDNNPTRLLTGNSEQG
jgi:hypothetical protein